MKGFENKQYTCALFLDLSKAFDTLEHHVLLDKLSTYEVQDIVLDWFKSYLSHWNLNVKFRAGDPTTLSTSDMYQVKYSVPQGSCLIPLLFLVLCNNLPLNLTLCKGILFADDTTIYKTHSNITYLMWSMSEE